jgi:hypothetical protein
MERGVSRGGREGKWVRRERGRRLVGNEGGEVAVEEGREGDGEGMEKERVSNVTGTERGVEEVRRGEKEVMSAGRGKEQREGGRGAQIFLHLTCVIMLDPPNPTVTYTFINCTDKEKGVSGVYGRVRG